MFEAAIRILEEDGLAALTTNRIAALAGVSIGTLYQYFPDKRALLAALARRELDQTFHRLQGALRPRTADAATPADPAARARDAVRVMLGAFGGRTRARRQLVQALMRSGQAEVFDEHLQALAVTLLVGAEPAHGAVPADVDAFVIARAVSGALRAAVLRDDALLRAPAFEAALVRLIVGFFAGAPPAPR